MTQLAVLLKNLTLTLPSRAGNVEILRGVDLSVNAGEAVERATSGTLEVAGTSLKDKNEDALAAFRRDAIGIIFQSFHLIPTMTALENVSVPLEFRGVADAMQMAEEKLKRVGLGHRMSHYPGQLSGGEQQRVAIARALASGARILLADEPTGNLDQETGEQIIRLLFELKNQEGASLLLITHDRALARRCDRIAEVRDGKIISGNHP
jgi:putative ABC transport system ATP-binding protein